MHVGRVYLGDLSDVRIEVPCMGEVVDAARGSDRNMMGMNYRDTGTGRRRKGALEM